VMRAMRVIPVMRATRICRCPVCLQVSSVRAKQSIVAAKM